MVNVIGGMSSNDESEGIKFFTALWMVNSNRVCDFGPKSMLLLSEEVDITNNFAREQLGLLVPSKITDYFKIVKKSEKKD